MNRRSLILAVLVVAVAGFATTTWYASRLSSQVPAAVANAEVPEALSRPWSPVLGPEKAPVTIVEFLDPACEACRAFYPIVKDILETHGDSVRLMIRYAPLHGATSEQAIRVLEAARMQNIYEPVLEALLREQPRWASHGMEDAEVLLEVAKSAGLDVDEARSQLKSPDTTGMINQDKADLQTMGVRGTPTFFVNGQLLDPFGADELRALVAEVVGRDG